ncbi:MAG: tetratricopeptide repeat protein [Pirellulales bacterium]|nr:tetratricopeptide repeat protein [Pirellulales bacterium]
MYVRLPPLAQGSSIFWTVVAWVAFQAATAPAVAWKRESAAVADSPARPERLILEDDLQPLVPRQPRTEAETDRLEALALFAAGRMHERRYQYAEALRLYQRALRCDPQATTVAQAIVPLAFRLKRHAEAVRYALKAAEAEDADPLLLQRLGAHLIEMRDFAGAARLYDKAAAAAETPPTLLGARLWMDAGRLLHVVQQYDQAAGYFARVRDALENPQQSGFDEEQRKRLLGDPGETYNLFGECFLRANRREEAAAAFRKADELAPNKALREYNLARVLAEDAQPQKALAGLQAAFEAKLADQGVAPYELFAKVLDQLGRKDELVQRLEKLREQQPENVPLAYFLAEQYRKAEQFEKADSFYRKLIAETPTLTGYRSLVSIRRKTNRPDALLDVLGEVVAKTGSLETLGTEAEGIAGDADLVRTLTEAARTRYRGDPEKLDYGTRLAVASLALQAKQFEAAGEFFELALEAEPDRATELLLMWGLGLLFEERPAEAAAVFQRAIDRLDEEELAKTGPALHHYLAGALTMAERTDEALAAARKAVEMGRTAERRALEEAVRAETARTGARNADEKMEAAEKTLAAAATAAQKKDDLVRFRSRVAWILYRAKRHDEATSEYLRLVRGFDSEYGSSEIREVLREARLVLSNLYVIKEDLAEAEEWLEQVLDEFPDDVGASNDLGYLWADQGRHLQRAWAMIRHATDAQPDNAAYRDSLGWVLYRLGRYPEAVAELEAAAAADPQPDALILDHLGDAYLKAGQGEQAEQAWRRAVEAFRKQDEPEKAKQVEEKMEGT